MKTIYKPYSDRVPDYQYQDAIRLIINEGIMRDAPSGVRTKTHIGIQMRFPVSNGCPLPTERDLSPIRKKVPTIWRQAIGELIAFINGARTHKEISNYGCHWWRHFLTERKCLKRGLEHGDNGPGSYGAAFHDFPMPDGGSFNQVAAVIQQMKERPELKTHFISPWIPFYTFRGEKLKQKVVICPCHGWMQFFIFDKKLTLHMTQRSGDFPIGVPNNMVQYFAFLLMVAKVLDLEPHEYIHYVVDAHVYENQIVEKVEENEVKKIEELVSRKPRPFPTLKLLSDKKDIFEFRHEDFDLEDYSPHPEINFLATV